MRTELKAILLFLILVVTTLLLSLQSCSYDGLSYLDHYNDWIDQNDTTIAPIDTVPQPLVIDSCEQLFFLTDTEYVMLISAVGVTGWFYGDEIKGNPTYDIQYLIDSLLPQMTYKYYEQNGRISIVMEGPGLHGISWLKFGSHNITGQGITLNPYYNSLNPMGSMTYDEYKYESTHRLNTNYFSLLNCGYTPDQNNSIARINLHPEECKHGGSYASYHGANGMQQSVIDSTYLFLWARVRL